MKFTIPTFLSFLTMSASLQCVQPNKTPPPDTTALRKPLTLCETYDNNGYNVGARADLLCMVYQVPTLNYAYMRSTAAQVLSGEIYNVPGEVSVGCDLALLYTMPNQPGYSFEFGWYHIVAQFSRNITEPHLVPGHTGLLTVSAPGNATIDAHVTFNLFDLLIKKDFAFGNWFAATPAIGLIGGYMNGVSDAHFQATSGGFSTPGDGNTASTVVALSYKTDYEGIGIKLGTSCSFRIWKGFKLQGNFFYNVIYGPAKVVLNYSQNGLSGAGTVSAVNSLYRQHQARSFFDSLLGLAWGTSFRRDSLFIDLHAGWRFQAFFDGWKEYLAAFDDTVSELSLTGQGLQTGVTFKF